MGYLVDSNILIDYAAERFYDNQLKALDIIFDESLKISVITKIEVLGYNGIVEDIDTQIHQFIASADILNLTDTIVDKTIGLRKQIKIKLPDAIIAATALASDLTLITNNTSDFKRVSGLKLFNPHEI